MKTYIKNSAYKVLAILFVLLPFRAKAIESVDIGLLKYDLYSPDLYAVLTGPADDSEDLIGDLEIPDSVEYNGTKYQVTTIGLRAFSGCKGLRSVTIPNSVTLIGAYSFNQCTGLTSVTIPNSVTEIDESVFSNCSGLTSVTIPNSVTSIGSNAFAHCDGLKEVHSTDLEAWCKIDFRFSGNPLCNGGDLYLNGELVTDVVIPETIKQIKGYTFYHYQKLTSLTIPESVTSIGSYAFYGCSGLTSVTIPDSVTEIGQNTFEGCSNLTSVTIGNSVAEIGISAFSECTGLTSVIIPNSVKYIPGSAFNGCSGLTSVIIGNSVDEIRNFAFYGCTNLTSLTCLSARPPQALYYTPFNSLTYDNATLYVPQSAVSNYKNSDKWEKFRNISASIILTETEWSGYEGESFDIEATVLQNDVLGKPITWSSSDTTVATVDENGRVTTVSVGKATITATCVFVTATCKVTVNADPSGIEDVTSDCGVRVEGGSIVAPEGSEVFDLSGRRLRPDGLRPGIYIVRTPGTKAVKVHVR